MGNIVGAIVLGVIAIICFVFSYLQFNEKGFLFNEEFTVRIPFTHESWNGRMKACRGIGASLTEKEISMWEQEHRTLLEHIAPNEFDILHYGAIAELKKALNSNLEELSMADDKRKLTEKELKRKDCFEKISSEMQQKGYKMKNVVINTQKAKYFALLVMFPFMALTFWLYNNVNGFNLDGISWGYAVALPLLILCLIIVHELIHGITWAIFAKNHFHAIDFGIVWSTLSPYCTCFEPLKKWQYLLGTAMPTLVLGGGGAAAAVMTNQLLLFFAAEYMILSGGGDFQLILRSILTDKRESLYCAHPYECGFVVFEK